MGIIVIIIAGLRYDTGTDYWNYFEQYQMVKEYGFAIWYEPLYVSMILMAQSFNLEFYSFLFLFYSLTIFLLLYILPKLTPLWLLSFSIYALAFMPNNGMGTIRFGLAIVITLYAVKYAIEKKLLKFLFIVIVATLIHKAMIFFIIVYYIIHLKFTNVQYMFIYIFAILLGMTSIIENIFLATYDFTTNFLPFLGGYNVKMGSYIIGHQEGSIALSSVIKKSFLLFYFLYYRKQILTVYPHYNSYLNIVVFGYSIYFVMINTFATFAIRLSSMFSFYEMILLPLPLLVLHKRINILLLYLFIFILSLMKFAITIMSWQDYFFPYQNLLEFLI